jgi:hypothetical protein
MSQPQPIVSAAVRSAARGLLRSGRIVHVSCGQSLPVRRRRVWARVGTPSGRMPQQGLGGFSADLTQAEACAVATLRLSRSVPRR